MRNTYMKRDDGYQSYLNRYYNVNHMACIVINYLIKREKQKETKEEN